MFLKDCIFCFSYMKGGILYFLNLIVFIDMLFVFLNLLILDKGMEKFYFLVFNLNLYFM